MKKLTNKEFIEKAKKVHGDKYSYDMVIVNGTDKKVLIKCPTHGYFKQTANNHLRGHGCDKCAHEENTKNRTKKQEEFLKQVIDLRPELNFSKFEYINHRTPGVCICNIHGEFEKTPSALLDKRRQGCPMCSKKKKGEEHRLTRDEFIKRANLIHNNKYGYEDAEYKTIKDEIAIKCPLHGPFKQTPDGHLHGWGCPECGKEQTRKKECKYVWKTSDGKALYGTTEIAKHYHISKPMLDSRLQAGINLKTAIKMPRRMSIGEIIIKEKLDELNLNYIHDKGFKKIFDILDQKDEYMEFNNKFRKRVKKEENDNNYIGNCRFDYTLISEDKKIIGFIEFDGEQHFFNKKHFFKVYDEFIYRRNLDRFKTNLSEEIGIPLLRIRCDQLNTETVSNIIDDFIDSIKSGDNRYLYQHNPYLTNEEYHNDVKHTRYSKLIPSYSM